MWTPPTTLANGNDYALEIVQGSQYNYFGPFQVQGADAMVVRVLTVWRLVASPLRRRMVTGFAHC